MQRQLGNDLGVGVRLKSEALLGQEQLDVLVVGDDTVVHQAEGVVLVRTLRVSVSCVRNTVGCPASVSNANMAVSDGVKRQRRFIFKMVDFLNKGWK